MRKTVKGQKVVPIRSARATEIRGPLIGRVVRSSREGFTVDFPGNPHGPTFARSIVPLGDLTQACEARARPEVLLLFEAERSDSPVIIGLLSGASETKSETKKLGASERREALVDGRRVVLDAKDELILKCGKATIVMRRNGRIVARGTHVETDSEGVNRVKGGSVQIN